MDEIKKKVKDIIEEYRSSNPFVIAKKAKIEVFYRDLGNIKGIYRMYNNMKFIVLNYGMSEFLEKMVLAHELGHAFLHENEDILTYKEKFLRASNFLEIEANKFAAYLLLNKDTIENIEYDIENEYEVNLLKNLYQLSLE